PNIEISPTNRIEYCTEAIRSRTWSGKGIAWAYNSRGIAYTSIGQYDEAVADFDDAIKLDPQDGLLRYNRANAWREKGDYERAIAGYTEAIALDSNYAPAYRGRGFVNFYKGDFAAAAPDFLQSNNLRPDERSTLWRFLARGRIGQIDPAELAANAAKLEKKDWL